MVSVLVCTTGGLYVTSLYITTDREVIKTPKEDLFDPYVNVTVGIKYLSHLNQHFDDMDATLTAYSHGPTVTKKYSSRYIKNNFYVKRVYKNL